MMNSIKYIFSNIGNTPTVTINSAFNKNKKLLLKLENKNPSGTIKDRLARIIINNNLDEHFFIDSSIGNFAISLSWLASLTEKKAIFVVNKNFDLYNLERIKAYGGDLIFSDEKDQLELSHLAKEIAIENGYYYCGQYFNSAYESLLGKEIVDEIRLLEFDSIFSYYGSGGIINGINKNMPRKVTMVQVVPDMIPSIKSSNSYHKKHINMELINDIQSYLLKKCGIHAGTIGSANTAAAMLMLEEEKVFEPLVLISDSR